MNKYNYQTNSKTVVSWIAVFLMLFTVCGFLGARAITSSGTILIGVLGIYNVPPRRWLEDRFWILGACWFLLLSISLFWSQDLSYGLDHLQVKLTLLLLPLAIRFLPRFSYLQQQVLILGVAVLMLSGIGFSLYHLAIEPDRYLEGYRFSHMLWTPVYRDHISFSIALVFTIVWCFYGWTISLNSCLKWIYGLFLLLFSVYIHLLAAKTGIIGLYLVLIYFLIRLLLNGKKKIALMIFAGGIVLLIICYNMIPTLQARVGYIKYSWNLYQDGNISGNYGDMGRLVSYDIALKILADDPLTGAGIGDMMQAMKIKYQQDFPDFITNEFLLPHNQPLTVAIAGGLFPLLLFLIWMLYPFHKKEKSKPFATAVWIGAFFVMMINPMMEIHAGIFAILFFYLIINKFEEEQVQPAVAS